MKEALSAVSRAMGTVQPSSVESAAKESMKCELLYCLGGRRGDHHPLAEKIINDLYRLQHALNTEKSP